MVLAAGVALLSGLAIPLDGLGVVLRDAPAQVVPDAEVVLGLGDTLLGKWLKLAQRRRLVAALVCGETLGVPRPGRGGQANQNGDGEYETFHETWLPSTKQHTAICGAYQQA